MSSRLTFPYLLEDNVTYGKSIENEHLSDGFTYTVTVSKSL